MGLKITAGKTRVATAAEKSRSSDGDTRSTVAGSLGFGVPDPRSVPAKGKGKEAPLLAAITDKYGGVTVTIEDGNKTPPIKFKASLKASLELWASAILSLLVSVSLRCCVSASLGSLGFGTLQ